MKKGLLFFALLAFSFACFGQVKSQIKKSASTVKAGTAKFGALAIDRNNGFYYGWSSDYATLVEAEKRAVEECQAKGGNCTVVLSYSGEGCVAYRTVDGNVGTAFGWGLAKTKDEADAIAMKEALKRSNGIHPINFVWSCNSKNTGTFKEIYNASREITAPVKIGNQIWSSANLNASTFRNGEPIFYASNENEWEKASREQIPAYCYLNFDDRNEKQFGKLYNYYAVADSRGLAPEGWHVPSKNEYELMITALGGAEVAGKKIRSLAGWDIKDEYDFAYGNGDNSSGLNLLFNGSASGGEYGAAGTFKSSAQIPRWWTSTSKNESFAWFLDFNKYSEPRLVDYSKTTGNAVRIVQD